MSLSTTTKRLLPVASVFLALFATPSLTFADGETTAMWTAEIPEEWGAAGREFEKWRSQGAPENGVPIKLEEFRIPARDGVSMVRVSGTFIPPMTGQYSFRILGANGKTNNVDAAQILVRDPAADNWTVVRKQGYPDFFHERIPMEEGIARPFEFWTLGDREISVFWRVEAPSDKAASGWKVVRGLERVQPEHMASRGSLPDDRHGDGLRDGWKRKWGLDVNSSLGPAGPWGDPDGDGIVNWREQKAGSDPTEADATAHSVAGLARWEIWKNLPGR